MLDPNLSYPMTAIRPSPIGLGAMQASAQSAYARNMPDLRQTLEGVMPTQAFERSKRSEQQRTEVTIFHPALGPSTEITESALMARALLSPTYMHDSAATRMARVSTMPNRELARFGGAVDIWA